MLSPHDRFKSISEKLGSYPFGLREFDIPESRISGLVRSGKDSDPFSDEFRHDQYVGYLIRENDAFGATIRVDELRIYEQPDGTLLAHNSHGLVENLDATGYFKARVNVPFEEGTVPLASQPLAVESTLLAIEQQLASMPA